MPADALQYDASKRMYYRITSSCCGASMTQRCLMNGKPLAKPFRSYLNDKGTAYRQGIVNTQLHYCDDCGEITNFELEVRHAR